jgi:hypothetical protein
MVTFSFDYSEVVRLVRWNERIAKENITDQAISSALNEYGDGLAREMRQDISNTTGLSTEAIRSHMVTERASPGNLNFDIDFDIGGLSGDIMSRPVTTEDNAEGGDPVFGEEQMVQVLLNGGGGDDDRTCDVCREIAAGGPYTIAEARSNIHHGATIGLNRCRCIIVPWKSTKRLPVTFETLVGNKPTIVEKRVSIDELAKILAREIEIKVLGGVLGKIS